MSRELPKAYQPREVEERIYLFWRESGCFAAPVDSPAPPYCITIPPPNVTGELHMGHALQHSIHDLIIRRKRMQGFNTLCLPGTDHAGIGTQMKVEQSLKEQGLSRRDLGREGFGERARDWTLKYGGAILRQLEALGCSYDWSRLRFTLDEFVEQGTETAAWALGTLYERSGYARAVLTAFVAFYEKGWIYRGERIVNWCPHCRTVVSDLEVQHREVPSHLWHIRYPAADGGPGLVVATTRPETMLGDTGVAVHPSDERYRTLVGATLVLPLLERSIPVVADHQVDPGFGSGAVKVTPAHDPNDWEISRRHPALLPPVTALDDAGVMTGAAGPYAGLPRDQARRRVIDDLRARGLLERVEPYVHSVGHHDRCDTVVEPLLKLQWFARCRELADLALGAIREGRVTFTPRRFTQMEVDWLESIRDWCVSRQLWWGHRIPLWYCTRCDPGVTAEESGMLVREDAKPLASVDPPGPCARCGAPLEQDPDVLDTWFSSALWPHATLGWPERTEDLARFYPTDLMITGRDILYLWVARMIMTGEQFLGREPFREVLIHATVLTEDGQRMSKSLGTGVDPLELIRLYGADATRFGLTSLVTESQDIRFKLQWASGGKVAAGPGDPLGRAEQIEQARNFCNKLWNISRFVLMNCAAPAGEAAAADPSDAALVALRRRPDLSLADRWILARFAGTAALVNDALDRYALGEASWALYHFVWDEFADWYVELAKPRLRQTDAAVRPVLLAVLEGTLRLAHPFLPFITEEVWGAATAGCGPLARATYPGSYPDLRDEQAEARMAAVIEVSRAARNLKAELGVPNRVVDLHLVGGAEVHVPYVEQAARVRVTLAPAAPRAAAAQVRAGGADLFIAAAGLVDRDAEAARVRRELAALEATLAGVQKKLANEQFLARAPEQIVERQRALRTELIEQRARLQERLRTLGVE
jgi:valyl-tRNA synthetase